MDPQSDPEFDYYFDSYAHISIHRTMLSDRIRTLSYREAIFRNPSLFQDKIILDVGCGTGILSLFAAKCGAKRVYAVEKSQINHFAKQIIDKNGFSNQISLIEKTMEEVTETDIPEKVDVIISEWMGYCLLYESMLPSVIVARNKFMKPPSDLQNNQFPSPITVETIRSDEIHRNCIGNHSNVNESIQQPKLNSDFGTMFPSKAKMYISAIEDSPYFHRKFTFWENICGFDFTPIKDWALIEPLVEACPEKQIITDDCLLIEFDLNRIETSNLSFTVPFKLHSLEPINMNGFVVWFDVLFEGPEAAVLLSTSPFDQTTHWSQTIFYLKDPIELTEDSIIEGLFSMKPNDINHRDQDVSIQFKVNEKEYVQLYKLR